MARSASLLKRLLVGRPFRSDESRPASLPKRIALPIFGSDPLSSVAYAPGQILIALSVAGGAAYVYAPWVAAAVVVVLLSVVASYRQIVRAYPSGGGDYEVATANLGARTALLVASALLVDYMLTVAVSVAAAVDHLGAVSPAVVAHRVPVAVAIIVALVGINLRGVRQSGVLFALPTYLFLAGMAALVGWGLFRVLGRGEELRAESADLVIDLHRGRAGRARAGVPARPRVRLRVGRAHRPAGPGPPRAGVPPAPGSQRRPHAAHGGADLGRAAAGRGGAGQVDRAALRRAAGGADPGRRGDYVQPPVTAQLAEVVFDRAPLLTYLVLAATALVLVFAANTTFEGFPMLGAALASHRYLPRQLHTRGDRLAFSNGIMVLGAAAIVLVVAFRADPVALIHLYIVGVFTAFTASQMGMVRHWNGGCSRNAIRWPGGGQPFPAVNAFGAVLTAVVLGVTLVAKFDRGVWLSVVAIGVVYLLMRGIYRHYDQVTRELAPVDERPVLPARNHAVVLVSRLHQPAMRALAYAQATRPDTLTAVTVNVAPPETRRLVAEWEGRDLAVPLTVVDSPYREITRPVIDFIRSIRRSSPRDVVTVFIPEYVVGRWWEKLLHNQSALRLRTRLHNEPGVMVTSVPWQLASSGRDLSRGDRMVRARGGRDVPDFERAPRQ